MLRSADAGGTPTRCDRSDALGSAVARSVCASAGAGMAEAEAEAEAAGAASGMVAARVARSVSGRRTCVCAAAERCMAGDATRRQRAEWAEWGGRLEQQNREERMKASCEPAVSVTSFDSFSTHDILDR